MHSVLDTWTNEGSASSYFKLSYKNNVFLIGGFSVMYVTVVIAHETLHITVTHVKIR